MSTIETEISTAAALRDRLSCAVHIPGDDTWDEARAAVETGDLPEETNPKDTAFALYALASAASVAIQLEEPGAKARARRCMRAVLGVTG